MKAKQVSYRRLWNLGNYENIAVELVANVTEDEAAETVLDQLEAEATTWYAMRMKSGGGK